MARTAGSIQFRYIHGPAEPLSRLLQHQPDDGIGAAQRLEAAEPEPQTLILDVQRADAEFGRQRRQGMQRRLGMVLAMAEKALGLVGPGKAERQRRRPPPAAGDVQDEG